MHLFEWYNTKECLGFYQSVRNPFIYYRRSQDRRIFCAGRSFADYGCFYILKNSLREGGLDESGSMKLLLSMDRVDLEDGYNKCFVLQKCLKQLFENV